MFLVRHGATANNTARPPVLQGRGSDLPMSEIGLRQARETAGFLSGHAIAAVYASPLRRARETAEEIARPHGLPVETLPELIECDVGVWEGMSWAQIAADHPVAHRRFLDDPAQNPYLGGETLEQVRVRAAPALDRLLLNHTGQSFVVVAHNVVNRVYLACHLGVRLLRARCIPQANCGVNTLESSGGSVRVLTVNQHFHLTRAD